MKPQHDASPLPLSDIALRSLESIYNGEEVVIRKFVRVIYSGHYVMCFLLCLLLDDARVRSQEEKETSVYVNFAVGSCNDLEAAEKGDPIEGRLELVKAVTIGVKRGGYILAVKHRWMMQLYYEGAEGPREKLNSFQIVTGIAGKGKWTYRSLAAGASYVSGLRPHFGGYDVNGDPIFSPKSYKAVGLPFEANLGLIFYKVGIGLELWDLIVIQGNYFGISAAMSVWFDGR